MFIFKLTLNIWFRCMWGMVYYTFMLFDSEKLPSTCVLLIEHYHRSSVNQHGKMWNEHTLIGRERGGGRKRKEFKNKPGNIGSQNKQWNEINNWAKNSEAEAIEEVKRGKKWDSGVELRSKEWENDINVNRLIYSTNYRRYQRHFAATAGRRIYISGKYEMQTKHLYICNVYTTYSTYTLYTHSYALTWTQPCVWMAQLWNRSLWIINQTMEKNTTTITAKQHNNLKLPLTLLQK